MEIFPKEKLVLFSRLDIDVLNIINGFNSNDSNLFYLKRISAGTGTSLNETIFKSSGLWIKMKNLFHFLG